MSTRNPAIARRTLGKTYTPARLTDRREHFTAEDTRKAQRAVAEVFAGRGVPLGQGNFGAAFRVEVDGAPVLVKMGSRRDMHTRTPGDMYGWLTSKYAQGGRSLETARRELIHEAGVSNELWALGHRVVPATIYAEYKGRPALVREYGQIPANITPQEYDALSRDLARVVADGWAVADELLIARRADGSLFVADVGLWHPYNPGPEGTGLSYSWSTAAGQAYDRLCTLLSNLSQQQAWATGAVPWSRSGTLRGQPTPSAIELKIQRLKLADKRVENDDMYEGLPPAIALRNLKFYTDAIEKSEAARRAVGLPV